MSMKGWGSNTFYSTLSDEQYEHTDKFFTAIKAEAEGGGSTSFRLSIGTDITTVMSFIAVRPGARPSTITART